MWAVVTAQLDLPANSNCFHFFVWSLFMGVPEESQKFTVLWIEKVWVIYQKGKKLIFNFSLIALQLTFEDLCFARNSFPTIFPINCFPINCFCTYYLPWIVSLIMLGDKEKRNVSQYPIEANVCIKFPRMKKSNKGKCESWWENIKLSSGCPAEGKWYKILIRHFVLPMEILGSLLNSKF